MTARRHLQVSARKLKDKLTPDQERFRYLLAQIEKVRKGRTALETDLQKFRRADAEHMQPLRASLRTVLRDTVFTIDRTLTQGRWAQIDRAALEEILRNTAQLLLEAGDDAEIKRAFDQHSTTTFDDGKREELERLKAEAESALGIDLSDADIETEDDLAQRMYEHMDKERRHQAEESTRSRKSTAQQRVEAAAQAAKRSLREMYRKLASAVHPDREPDAKLRAEKNELMQSINRAYATNDLLTLLEAQMRLEQIDPDHIARLSGERLGHYNKLLAEQLNGERKTSQDLEAGFRMDFGLEDNASLAPHKLVLLTRQRARGIRAEIERQKQFLLVLRTPTATKRWLKSQRQFARGWDDDDEDL